MPSNASQGASVAETQKEPWTLFTDGSSCVDGSGAWLILTNPDGVEFSYALRFQFAASNNESEYEALIAGLRIAAQMGVKNIQANVDSKLVANQVLGAYLDNEDNMIKYLEITKALVRKEVTAVIEEEGPTWMTELVNYLKEGILPGDEKEARKLHLKARQYELMEGVLYKRSFLTPCDCQVHCPITRHPQQPLTLITAPWPFYKWGIDIAGPFPKGPGKVKFLIVAMDYFTKWISKSSGNDTGGQVKKFVWDNIVCRFSIPGEIISDNGKQFADNPFKDWCDKLNIKQHFASVKHPQSNGLVERANRSLGEGIKARLGEGNKNWVEELPHIGMPTYRTTVVDVVNNDELRLNLDLLEERRELAAMSEARFKSKMMKYYNSRVRGVAFKPGDFVYSSNDASHAVAGGKLGPKWEDPYEVTDALRNGAYKLRSMDGTMLLRT
nr:hypothetical protein [Tanacetum cinerariifolium]